MYKLKQVPEDFVVKEIISKKLEQRISNSGNYAYFILKKINLNTLDAVKIISKKLNLKEKQIGFAGNKDKIAVTEQLCSAFNTRKEKLEDIKLENIEFFFQGYGSEPVSLGDLEGNYFEIIIRNLIDFKIKTQNLYPNYFDEQRFSKSNKEIGKSLLKKEFSNALELLDNSLVNSHLKEKPKDYIGAIKKLPLRLLRLYINAYQSYLWNETLAEYLRKSSIIYKELDYSLGKIVFLEDYNNIKIKEIPLIGFDSDVVYGQDELLNSIIKDIMQKEGIDFSDFIIREIPQLTLEGEKRKIFAELNNLVIKNIEKDELNPGKNKVKVCFKLGKGSYATMAIKSLMLEFN